MSSINFEPHTSHVERPRGSHVLVVLLLLTVGVRTTISAQQDPSQRSAVITGRVIDAGTGQPLAGATVTRTLSRVGATTSGPPDAKSVQSGADGSFVFDDLEAGSYYIRSEVLGYESGFWGHANVREAFTPLLPLQRDERAEIVIKMWRHGVIAGTIVEQDGQPAVGLSVSALRRQGATWVRGGGFTFSDDRGRYGLSVPPGDYLVTVQTGPPANARLQHAAYAPAERTSVTATVVKVRSGEEIPGVDLGVDVSDSPDSGHQVAGAVRSPDGNVAHLDVRLVPAGAGTTAMYDQRSMRTDASGHFSFSNIPSGDYVLQVVRFPDWPSTFTGVRRLLTADPGGGIRMSNPGGLSLAAALGPSPSTMPEGPTFVADVPVTVGDSDIASIDVPLVSGARVRGRLVFDGADPPAPSALSSMSVLVLPDSSRFLPNVPEGRVEADGSFLSIGMPPGRYGVGVHRGLPAGWTAVSMQSGGREFIGRPVDLGASDADLVITFTRKMTELVGTVRDSEGRTLPSGRVYVFPRDPQLRVGRSPVPVATLVHQTQSSPTGRFEVKWMLPGDYYVAYSTEPPEDWSEPGFLDGLAKTATPVHVELGETQTLELRVNLPR